MKDWHIVVRGKGAVSASTNKAEGLSRVKFENGHVSVGKLAERFVEEIIDKYKISKNIEKQDLVVLYALEATSIAIKEAEWENESDIAVNVGSSRGATELLEKAIVKYYNTKECDAYTSPLTTLGNISTAISNQFGLLGYSFSHSITCSTSASAFVNAFAWLSSGMVSKMIAGGAEAPLTDFTISQMKNIGIYSQKTDSEYPSMPLGFINGNNYNSMVLGEGAGVIGLERIDNEFLKIGDLEISVIGYKHIPPPSFTGVESNGKVFYESMKQAVKNIDDIDAIFVHAPGTLKGDKSEYQAITDLFGEKTPVLYSNKWRTGHTLGASFALSLCEAIEILQEKRAPALIPYLDQNNSQKNINSILINSSGFGGNAVSVVVRKVVTV